MRDALTSRRSAIEHTARRRSTGQPVSEVREGFTHDEKRELAEIDGALKRMQQGSYGHCERCGTAIGRQRLRAMPEAARCEGCTEPEPQGRRR
ncbi:MAG: TraR/DksA C4-type zinc finger protein [Archangiaceae bacterium]|nr:TraR/DksA C4-type zinc finger protein [Archangiaceae bacterium]